MSPLVFSLLALATLLATVATDDQPNRVKLLIGKIRPPAIKLKSASLPAGGDFYYIAHRCEYKIAPGSDTAGVKIIATNNDPSGQAPVIYFNSDYQFRQFEVKCPDGCPQGVTVDVKAYCTAPS